jgi:predicted transcriptional regulator
MKPKNETLTGLELEIMKIVWDLKKATVRDVFERLAERRKIAYTTVMTMMKILEQKGFVDKSEKDRAYLYRPTKPERKVMRAMVREFVDRVFNGSAEPLLVHLVEDKRLSEEEVTEILDSVRKAPKER